MIQRHLAGKVFTEIRSGVYILELEELVLLHDVTIMIVRGVKVKPAEKLKGLNKINVLSSSGLFRVKLKQD